MTVDADGENLSWTEYASAGSWDMLEDSAAARPRDVAVQSFTFINPIGQTLRYRKTIASIEQYQSNIKGLKHELQPI